MLEVYIRKWKYEVDGNRERGEVSKGGWEATHEHGCKDTNSTTIFIFSG